jgi:hypothetical protein
MNSFFNDLRASFDVEDEISEARRELILLDSYKVLEGCIFLCSNFFTYKLYLNAVIIDKAAFLVKKRWCMAFF